MPTDTNQRGGSRRAKRWRPLKALARPDRMPLSYGQERLWFLDRLGEGRSREYNMPGNLRLRGPLDEGALRQAIATIVARHESLRTHVAEVDGEAVQVIVPEVTIPLPIEDLSAWGEEARWVRVEEALRRERDAALREGRWCACGC